MWYPHHMVQVVSQGRGYNNLSNSITRQLAKVIDKKSPVWFTYSVRCDLMETRLEVREEGNYPSIPNARQALYDVCQGTYGAMMYPLYNRRN